jgi:ubiquinone/menaquinone biosynthesis C-methylase UbiE
VASTAQAKWDKASGGYDRLSRGAERRWEDVKRESLSKVRGRVLFLAVGTGLEVRFFPPGADVTGIDISSGMLRQAAPRATEYDGSFQLTQADVEHLAFPDATFDCVVTSCTFCSVPNPVVGLRELRRVLKPGGELRMFEHTGSRWFPFNLMLNLMTPVTRQLGPDMNRDTVSNVRTAGFRIHSIRNVYLDVVKIIVAGK